MPAFRSSATVTVPNTKSDVAVTTYSNLSSRPFVCVSQDEEDTFYQPMRVVGAVVLGPALLMSASRLPEDQGALKLLTAAAGVWMVAYNGLRHYEIETEASRYASTRDA